MIDRYYWWLEFSKVFFFLFNLSKGNFNSDYTCPVFGLSGSTIPPRRYDWHDSISIGLWRKHKGRHLIGGAWEDVLWATKQKNPLQLASLLICHFVYPQSGPSWSSAKKEANMLMCIFFNLKLYSKYIKLWLVIGRVIHGIHSYSSSNRTVDFRVRLHLVYLLL